MAATWSWVLRSICIPFIEFLVKILHAVVLSGPSGHGILLSGYRRLWLFGGDARCPYNYAIRLYRLEQLRRVICARIDRLHKIFHVLLTWLVGEHGLEYGDRVTDRHRLHWGMSLIKRHMLARFLQTARIPCRVRWHARTAPKLLSWQRVVLISPVFFLRGLANISDRRGSIDRAVVLFDVWVSAHNWWLLTDVKFFLTMIFLHFDGRDQVQNVFKHGQVWGDHVQLSLVLRPLSSLFLHGLLESMLGLRVDQALWQANWHLLVEALILILHRVSSDRYTLGGFAVIRLYRFLSWVVWPTDATGCQNLRKLLIGAP